MRERSIFVLRIVSGGIGVLVVSLMLFVSIVHAQTQPVVPVMTVEDARQDERIDDLKTWKKNQESWNDEQGRRVEELNEQLWWIKGIGVGGFAVLSILQFVQAFYQLRHK